MRSASRQHRDSSRPSAAASSNGHAGRENGSPSALAIDVVPARSGDHVSIFHTLQHIFHAPSAAEFQASQDAPLYEPSDRLIATCSGQLMGQVHTASRILHFDSLRLPAAGLHQLGVLPEYRGQGIGTRLLQAAQEKIVEDGGRLALLRTSEPQFFARRGWIVCGRHCYATATARNILAQLADVEAPQKSLLAPQRKPLSIRLWRQVEQDAIARLYQSSAEQSRGPIQRTHAYWRWLVSRHAYERIYVAVEADGKPDMDAEHSPIVGYAAMRDARILELHAQADHPLASRQLLARACGDAIERGESTVRLDGPPNEPLHRVMQQAGGRFVLTEAEQGEVLMAKLFDPLRLLDELRGDIFMRARDAGLSLPMELGLMIGGEKYQLVFTRRSAKLVGGKLGRSYLTCGREEFSRLLLGDVDLPAAESSGKIQASTRVAAEIAGVLFPNSPLWFPPLDHLPAP